MLPNCKEVKDLKLGPNKLNYVVYHGIYPYVQNVLKKWVTIYCSCVWQTTQQNNIEIRNGPCNSLLGCGWKQSWKTLLKFIISGEYHTPRSVYAFWNSSWRHWCYKISAGINGWAQCQLAFFGSVTKTLYGRELPTLADIFWTVLSRLVQNSTDWEIKKTLKEAFYLPNDTWRRFQQSSWRNTISSVLLCNPLDRR